MKVIDLTGHPEKPVGAQIDAAMRAVSEQLGETWVAGKVSGYWLFYRDSFKTAPVLQSKRKFDGALSQATGASIIRSVEI